MSVIQVKGNGPFGGFGGFATALGMMTGQPWLSGLGMGMNAVDSMSTGGSVQGAAGSFDQMINYLKQAGWINPASGNIASSNPQMSTAEYDELRKKWGPIDYGQNW